jgi:Cd2+/Zn2+-exporting ATPase
MSIASLGAFATGEYPEAIAVMLFFQVGEIFEEYAENKSKKSIESLMELKQIKLL